MGEWVSYPKFVSPATKRLHPRVEGEMFIGKQIATPANPAGGFDAFYFKADDNLYRLTPAGVETKIPLSGDIVNADVSSSAAITPDKLSGPLFSYYRNSSSNNVTGNGTVYTCLFDTAVISNANYNTSTGIFTAPAAGKYLFVGKVGVASGSSGGTQGEVNVVTTGRSYRHDGNPYGNRHIASGVTSIPFAIIASMAQNDTAKVTLTVTGDGSNIADFIGGAFSDFAGWRVG